MEQTEIIYDRKQSHGSLFTCGEASRSMDDIWLLSSFRKICPIQPVRGQRGTGTWVIEVTEYKFDIKSELALRNLTQQSQYSTTEAREALICRLFRLQSSNSFYNLSSKLIFGFKKPDYPCSKP